MVDACLPRPTLDETAWRAFAAAQQPDGAMPAIRDMPEGDEEAVDVVYHSTLVAAFASVLATSRPDRAGGRRHMTTACRTSWPAPAAAEGRARPGHR